MVKFKIYSDGITLDTIQYQADVYKSNGSCMLLQVFIDKTW